MDAVKLLGALLGNNATDGNLLGSILKGAGGGQQQQQAPQSRGPAGLLEGLLGGSGGGAQQQSSGGSILGGLLKAAVAKQLGGGGSSAGGGGGISDLLGGLLGGGNEPEPQVAPPQRQQANDQAVLLIRAMCNAAKADGNVDEAEQKNIIGRMGELDQSEVQFLRQELSSPLDVNGFVRSVPKELAPQVYALSIMTVKVDTRQEVKYLTQLAQGLGLTQQTLDAIHQQAGVA